MSFSFAFSGDDIQEDPAAPPPKAPFEAQVAASSAFPVPGKPLLPATHHGIGQMLASLPSKIVYSLLDVDLDGQGSIRIPRRELWDVRLQLMAEEDNPDNGQVGELEPGLGKHDVKTGIYEGGFKSWESSVDLVKVLAAQAFSRSWAEGPCRIVELGCGTALPSLALFQWAELSRTSHESPLSPLCFCLADYNPTVLQLVTMPNFLLAWALQRRGKSQLLQEAFSTEGELQITEQVTEAFQAFLASSRITLSFVSGGWSPEFVDLIYQSATLPNHPSGHAQTLILGAETIYSPFALNSFAETLMSILRRERAERPNQQAVAVIAAKRLYFGVGGSLDDFIDKMGSVGVDVTMMREETEGVRRGVVKCALP